jgi:hypothetical protein
MEMKDSALILPMLAMFALTVGIGIWMLALRTKAVKDGQINPGYFKYNRGGKLPEQLAQVTQHYENLFEAPLLFYVACLMLMFMHVQSTFFVATAWAYVASRLLHAWIHTTSNHILHRRNAFLLSSVLLICLWAGVAVQILGW